MPKRNREWLEEKTENFDPDKFHNSVDSSYIQTFYEARDAEIAHGTYQFEMQMLNYIRQGKPLELERHLLEFANIGEYYEGKVAGDELRQVKNVYISLTVMVGKIAAIPGGMPIEQAYYLIDSYTQQGEELETVEDIYNLQYTMLLDFAERVSRYQYSHELSPIIHDCINFIILNLNKPIRSADVVAYSGRSKSYLSEQFKKETGYEIGSYITRSKIDEAKSLLRYTDRSISEISMYLSYSSQPYFQNVFKKETGMTPKQYRNKTEFTDEQKDF